MRYSDDVIVPDGCTVDRKLCGRGGGSPAR
jgi:hypothetical protein